MENPITKTPVLSKKKQQKTFSSKKSRRETVKNLVTTPYVNYWPIIKQKDVDLLTTALYDHLKLFKHPKIKIPFKLIKDVPQADRKEFRIKYNDEQADGDEIIVDRNSIVLGVNNITRHLEKNALASVLITDDVNPHLMVRHLIDMSVMNSIPVLIIPKLKEILQTKIGTKSVAFGLKKNLEQHSDYFSLNEIIKSVYTNYPVPEAQINFPRQRLFDSNNIDETTEDLSQNLSLSSTSTSQDEVHSEESAMEIEEKPQDIYLYRKSKKERVFIPSSVVDVKLETDTLDFISFETENTKSTKNTSEQSRKSYETNKGVKREKSVDYRGLVVKRIKSNSERMQKKIKGIKNKSKSNSAVITK